MDVPAHGATDERDLIVPIERARLPVSAHYAILPKHWKIECADMETITLADYVQYGFLAFIALLLVAMVVALIRQSGAIGELKGEVRGINLRLDEMSKSHSERMDASSKSLSERIDEMSKSLSERMDASSKSLSERIDELRTNHSERMDAMSKSLSERIDELRINHSERMDAMSKSLSERIDELRINHSERMDAMSKSLSERIDELRINHSERMDAMSKSLSERIDELRTNHSERMDALTARVERLEDGLSALAREVSEIKGLLLALHQRMDLVMRHRHEPEAGQVILTPEEIAAD